ncbi:MAG: ornithine cyclodeaminase family protein [Burkholderiaceae bacterium]
MAETTPYFDDATVRRLLDLPILLDRLEDALVALSQGRAVQPLRSVTEIDPPTIPEAERTLLFLKPARLGDALVTKLITLAPNNAARGLPTLLATAVLMDAVTGRTRAVMDATWLTNLRTAGVSAVAARHLTPDDAGVVALLGSGALARTHALALRAVRPVREIRVWGRSPANVQACAAEIGGIACDSAEQAVRGADIVCTLTTSQSPVLQGQWLKPGALVNAVGAPRPTWRELDDAAMSHYVLADSRHAAETEAGDVLLSGARVQAEIGELLAGSQPMPLGRTVIFKALGQAVEDAAAAQLVYEAAQRAGLIGS